MSSCKLSWDDKKFDPVFRKADHERQFGDAPEVRKPKETCPACGEEIYLKWGKIITHPYWSHNRATGGCSWVPRIQSPESHEHLKAKRLVCELLNQGRVQLSTTCSICGKSECMPMPKLAYDVEVTDKENGGCRWDVAGVSAEGEIKAGIEVKHSHETSRTGQRSHVWWAEIAANDILAAAEDEHEPAVRLVNCRREQVCEECKEKAADQIRRRLEEAERIRLEKERENELEKQRKKKILDLATRLGYVDELGRFTDMVCMDDTVRKEIANLYACIRCGEEKTSHLIPYCWDCREEVLDCDRKNKIAEFAEKSGLLWAGTWFMPPQGDWRKASEDFWNNLSRIGKCVVCQKRQPNKKYARFPYCGDCCPKEAPAPASGSKRDMPPNPSASVKKINIRHEEKEANADTGDPMAYFMGNRDYGPSLGITPLHRYLRAKKLCCPMPPAVVELFEAQIVHDIKK